MNKINQIKKWIEEDPENQERETWDLLLKRYEDPNYVSGKDFRLDLMESVCAAIAGYVRVTGDTSGLDEVLERVGINEHQLLQGRTV